VLWAVLRGIAARYDVHYVGIGYKGPRRTEAGVTLHPSNLQGGDVFGAYQCAAMAHDLGAPLVLLLNDFWMLPNYPYTLGPLRDRVKTVAYVPVDGSLTDDRLLEPLASIDRFVAYTTFGHREIGAALASLRGRGVEVASTTVSIVPHGVDTESFRPLAGNIEAQVAPGGRLDIRRQLWPDEPSWHDAFIVLNANRPMPRKRIDLTIEGFARFARDKPSSVKLWLHHAIMHPQEHAALAAQIEQLGIGDRVRLSALGAPPLSDAELNLAYNAADVGLNTAMGEGWGLVSFEHAATGAAQVVPQSSACTELWRERAELVETHDAGVPPWGLLRVRTVTPEGVAQALDRLYTDTAHYRRQAVAAYRHVTGRQYSWSSIADQWCAVFDEVLGA
jgi:glycosyltransferase involved in cell wall biosynthesis